MYKTQRSITHSPSANGEPAAKITTDSVTCPECQARIPLSEALMSEFEAQSKERWTAELRVREATLRAEADQQIAAAAAEAEARMKEAQASHIADLEAEVREKAERIEQATATELQLRRRQRELEDREKDLPLHVAREVDAARKVADQQATDRLTEEFRLRESQMREQLASMTRTIEDLKRKAEQGSQQTQGEAVEVDLETMLARAFPSDEVAPVSKGVRGADIVHTVRNPAGIDCARIVWEAKNAKSWSPKWLEKIRDDQRDATADLAVIVTNVLPPGVRGFGQVEGVWICELGNVSALAVVLRAMLQAVQRERTVADGRNTKEAHLYSYVTGNEFQQRVISAVASLSQMKKDLEKERNSALRSFTKRDKQLLTVAGHIAEIYGSAQGIIGSAMPSVPLLEDTDQESGDEDEPLGLMSA